MKALNVNKLTKAGCTFKFWIADWFAMLNNKMGGDLKKIRNVGQYMIEVSADAASQRNQLVCPVCGSIGILVGLIFIVRTLYPVTMLGGLVGSVQHLFRGSRVLP